MNVWLAAVVAATFMLALDRRAPALTPAELYTAGVEARLQGRPAEALESLGVLLRLEPENADALVQRAYALLALDDPVAAAADFRRVLSLAPDYADARLGLAHADLRRGEPALAEADFAALAAGDHESAEVLVGLGDARRAQGNEAGARRAYDRALELDPGAADARVRLAAPRRPDWRIDLAAETSRLDGGREPWYEANLALGRRIGEATGLVATLRKAWRYGEADHQAGFRIDHAPFSRLQLWAGGVAGPDADFLASWALGGGLLVNGPAQPSIPPVSGGVDVRYAIYPGSSVTTVSPLARLHFWRERISLTGQVNFARDDEETRSVGYLARVDVVATDRVRLIGGYGDGPEISEGELVETRSIFGGIAWDARDRLTLRIDLAHEMRDAFDRTTIATGVAFRF